MAMLNNQRVYTITMVIVDIHQPEWWLDMISLMASKIGRPKIECPYTLIEISPCKK